jgi:hypothetical protein
MLVINQRFSKLKAARARFAAQGMMTASTSAYTALEQVRKAPVPVLPQAEADDEDDDHIEVAGAASAKFAATAGMFSVMHFII